MRGGIHQRNCKTAHAGLLLKGSLRDLKQDTENNGRKVHLAERKRRLCPAVG